MSGVRESLCVREPALMSVRGAEGAHPHTSNKAKTALGRVAYGQERWAAREGMLLRDRFRGTGKSTDAISAP